MRALGEKRSISFEGDTFGKILEGWGVFNVSPGSELDSIKDDLKTLWNLRNEVHLYKLAKESKPNPEPTYEEPGTEKVYDVWVIPQVKRNADAWEQILENEKALLVSAKKCLSFVRSLPSTRKES